MNERAREGWRDGRRHTRQRREEGMQGGAAKAQRRTPRTAKRRINIDRCGTRTHVHLPADLHIRTNGIDIVAKLAEPMLNQPKQIVFNTSLRSRENDNTSWNENSENGETQDDRASIIDQRR